MTRLQLLYFEKDLQNSLDMVYQLKHILQNYPDIQLPETKHHYTNKSLSTLMNTNSNLEEKSTIKEEYGDVCKAVRLLQVRCARITPQDTMRIEENFNNVRIKSNENATNYIRRFRDARLLAKCVRTNIEDSK